MATRCYSQDEKGITFKPKTPYFVGFLAVFIF